MKLSDEIRPEILVEFVADNEIVVSCKNCHDILIESGDCEGVG